MYKVFVFGTLKEGFPNFKTNEGSRDAGNFLTKNKYPLYLIGDRYVPWLVLDEGVGYQIKGEVYNVSAYDLVEIDKLEQTSEVDGYRRVELDICCGKTGQDFKAYVYGKTVEQLPGVKIQRELKGEYTLEHAKLFRSRFP
jgi:gamma-glutamylaminecyclotransferase